MKLEGIHHVTAITADAPGNVDFYTRVLGLRLVKKTVNQDDPTVYHLFYADELGSPGADLTFFEYPGLPRGRAGAGMVHTVVWRVGSEEAVAFWAERLAAEGIEVERDDGRLRFTDREGMGLEIVAVEVDDEPLVARHPEIPAEHALQGFHGVRAYTADPEASRAALEETLGFEPDDGDRAWEVRGEQRGSFYAYDEPPPERGAGRRRHRASRGVGIADGGARRTGASALPKRAYARRRSSTASTSGRSTSGSRAASSSSSPRWAPASPRTSRWRRSARGSRFRRTTSRCGNGWRPS